MADFTQLISQFLYSRLPQISGGGGSASGVLTVSTTSAATIADTNETDLWTYSLPANTLSADGRAVRITAFFACAANTNTKTVRLYFGGTLVKQRITAITSAGVFLKALVFRTGASTQLSSANDESTGGTADVTFATPAGDTTTALTIKVTGQNGIAAANDITFKGAMVELLN